MKRSLFDWVLSRKYYLMHCLWATDYLLLSQEKCENTALGFRTFSTVAYRGHLSSSLARLTRFFHVKGPM